MISITFISALDRPSRKSRSNQAPHTLQLLVGDKDHIPHSPPVMSPRIRVIASDATTSPQVAASVKKRRNAQARGRNYHSSAAYRKNSRSRSYRRSARRPVHNAESKTASRKPTGLGSASS
jgi:hypothetical protein